MVKIITDHHNKNAAGIVAEQLIIREITDSGEMYQARETFERAFVQRYHEVRDLIIKEVKKKSESGIYHRIDDIIHKTDHAFADLVFVFNKGSDLYRKNVEGRDRNDVLEHQLKSMKFLGRYFGLMLAVAEYGFTTPYGLILARGDKQESQEIKLLYERFAERLREQLKVDTKKLHHRFVYMEEELAATFLKLEKQDKLPDTFRGNLAKNKDKMLAFVAEVKNLF
jgi:hypothetical protein